MRRLIRDQKLLFADELDRPRGPSLVIPIIVTIEVVLFIVTMYVNDCPENTRSNCTFSFLGRLSFQPINDNPLLGPSGSALAQMGGLSSELIARNHQIWRPFSCIWLHAGVLHLLADLISLLFIGIQLEQDFGCWRIGCIYFLSGIGGSFVSSLFIENRVSVGSSGALFGIMGAILSELLFNWDLYVKKTKSLSALAMIGLVNFILGLFPHIDNFAHFGGFVFGMLLGIVFFIRPHLGWDSVDYRHPPTRLTDLDLSTRPKLAKLFIWSLAIVFLLVLYMLLMVLAFTGVDANKHCSWCKNFSCIPSSHWKCGDNRGSPICKYMITSTTLLLTCEGNQKSQQFTGLYSMMTIKQLCIQLCN